MSQLSLCQFNSWIISTMFSSGLLPLPSLQILSLSLPTMCVFFLPQALFAHENCSSSTPRKMFSFLVNFKSFLWNHGPPDVVLFKLLSSVRDLLFCSLSLWPNVLTYLLQHTSPDIIQTWKEKGMKLLKNLEMLPLTQHALQTVLSMTVSGEFCLDFLVVGAVFSVVLSTEEYTLLRSLVNQSQWQANKGSLC